MQASPRQIVLNGTCLRVWLLAILTFLILFHNTLFQHLAIPLYSPNWLREHFDSVQLLRSGAELLLIGAIFYLSHSKVKVWKGLPWTFRSAWQASCLSIIVLALYAICLLYLPSPERNAGALPLVLRSESLAWLLVNSVFLAALREELFFRAWLWDLLRNRASFSFTATVLLTAALFSLSHLPGYAPTDLAYLGVMGCLLGFLRGKYGLSTSIFIHVALNLLALSHEQKTVWLDGQSSWKTLLIFVSLTVFLRGFFDFFSKVRQKKQRDMF